MKVRFLVVFFFVRRSEDCILGNVIGFNIVLVCGVLSVYDELFYIL